MWQIIGIILFSITYYVHKHTYYTRYTWASSYRYEKVLDKKVKIPRILYLVAFLIFLVPVLNIFIFMIGAVFYLGHLYTKGIMFQSSDKFIKPISKFLKYMIKSI